MKYKKHIDPVLVELKESLLRKSLETLSKGEDEALRNLGRLCVPHIDVLRESILEEARGSRYSTHPSATKIYKTLQEKYLLNE